MFKHALLESVKAWLGDPAHGALPLHARVQRALRQLILEGALGGGRRCVRATAQRRRLQVETGIEEGCLSIPEQRALVPRAEKIKIRALDRDGNPFELEADDLLAICIQHEMDHLVGKLFIDYLSPLKQQRIRQKVEKLDRLRSRA